MSIETQTFKSDTYEEFTDQFPWGFLDSNGKVRFVQYPVRMVKIYNAEMYIIDFLKKDRGTKMK
jgi:hypothetical protein